MAKYKNKDGISLNHTGNDSHSVLVREVVGEAIKICSQFRWDDGSSMRWALQRTKDLDYLNDKSLYIKRVSRDFFMGTDIGTRKHKDKKKYTRKRKYKKDWRNE